VLGHEFRVEGQVFDVLGRDAKVEQGFLGVDEFAVHEGDLIAPGTPFPGDDWKEFCYIAATMRESWLKSNPRALGVLAPLPVLIILAGIALLLVAVYLRDSLFCWAVGGCVTLVGAGALLAAWTWTRRPRLAFEPGWLLVYLNGWTPERLPIDVVESFFRGNSSTMLAASESSPVKTTTIVARLAEARTEWHTRRTRAALGEWKDGYIVFRGTWCEPITVDLLRELNRRLVVAQREHCAQEAS